MSITSTTSRQKSWHRQRRHVSVLAEMAIRQAKVAERLQELRQLHNLTQEQAAGRVGVTLRQWQRWEGGESMPYPRNLDLIASRFQLSVSEFFEDEPAPIADDPAGYLMDLRRIEAKIDALDKKLDRIAAATGALETDDTSLDERMKDMTDQFVEQLSRLHEAPPTRRRSASQTKRAPATKD